MSIYEDILGISAEGLDDETFYNRVKKIQTNSLYGKMSYKRPSRKEALVDYDKKDSHMINCGVCHKPTDTFIKGGVTLSNGSTGKLDICAGCLTSLSKAFDKKYKKLPVIETEASEWEAWSTPTDES